jgi:hypothetical protein
VRLFRRFNPKHEVWPGGPQIGQVIEAQLSPPAGAPAGAEPAAADAAGAAEDDDTTAVDLLLLLRR